MAMHPDDDTHLATEAEADREWAHNVGRDHPERAWILSDRDVWYPNPCYSGPRVPHPEYDPDWGWSNPGDAIDYGAELARKVERESAAARKLQDDDIPF